MPANPISQVNMYMNNLLQKLPRLRDVHIPLIVQKKSTGGCKCCQLCMNESYGLKFRLDINLQ